MKVALLEFKFVFAINSSTRTFKINITCEVISGFEHKLIELHKFGIRIALLVNAIRLEKSLALFFA